MRSETATTRRVRLVIVLSVGPRDGRDRRHPGHRRPGHADGDRRQPAHLTRLGLDVIAAGVAFGLVVLVVFAIARIGGAGKRGPRKGRTGSPARSRPPGPRGGPPRAWRVTGAWQGRAPAGTPAGGGHAARDGAARSARPPLLNPTNVYSPGGLIDVPRDGHGSGTPGGEDIPEILRTAGPGPANAAGAGDSAGGRSQDRPSPGRAGPQSRHGYPPGMNPGGPGRAPYGPGGAGRRLPCRRVITGAPGRLRDPATRCRAVTACRVVTACRAVTASGREACPASRPAETAWTRQPGPATPPPGHAGQRRDSGPFRDPGPPRDGTGPGGPFRPGGPMPRATPPTRHPALGVRAAPRIAPPDGMRAVPGTPPLAAAGQGRRERGRPWASRAWRRRRAVRWRIRAGHPRVGSPGPSGRPGPSAWLRPSSRAGPATRGARSRRRVRLPGHRRPGGTGPERRRLLVRPARGGRRPMPRHTWSRRPGGRSSRWCHPPIRRARPAVPQRRPTPPAPIRRRTPPGRTTGARKRCTTARASSSRSRICT